MGSEKCGDRFGRKLSHIHPLLASFSRSPAKPGCPPTTPFFQWCNLLRAHYQAPPHLLHTPKASGRLLLVMECETNSNLQARTSIARNAKAARPQPICCKLKCAAAYQALAPHHLASADPPNSAEDLCQLRLERQSVCVTMVINWASLEGTSGHIIRGVSRSYPQWAL